MSIGIIDVGHVNVTVPASLEQAAKQFYAELLGLEQIPKPVGPRQFIGAWYQLGSTQLHLSIEDDGENAASDRHVCYRVANVGNAAAQFREAGVEIIPDAGAKPPRFFVRDPGANLIEITEAPTR